LVNESRQSGHQKARILNGHNDSIPKPERLVI